MLPVRVWCHALFVTLQRRHLVVVVGVSGAFSWSPIHPTSPSGCHGNPARAAWPAIVGSALNGLEQGWELGFKVTCSYVRRVKRGLLHAIILPLSRGTRFLITHTHTSIRYVVGVVKKGNIVLKARIKPRFLVFRDSVLTITPPRFPDVTTLRTPPCLCSSLPERSV